MINISLHDSFCLIEPLGPLTKEDFTRISSLVDPVIEKEGELDGLIIRTRQFPGWESFSDVVAHIRFVKDHHRKIEKVALVTDARVADLFPAVIRHFVKAEVRHFDFDDYEKAVEWVD